MSIEISKKGYYENSAKNYIDIHNSIKAGIEWTLSTLLFKKDLKKIIYSTPDISFRKRIELLDATKINDGYNNENLDLPYCSYYQSTDFEEDDTRTNAFMASSAIVGVYDKTLNRRIRFIPVKCDYEATLFFDRRDDIRVVQQTLFWEKTPKGPPISLLLEVSWKNQILKIPVNLTIKSIDSNIQYKETDFLSKTRIFPIKLVFEVKSFQVLIENVDNIFTLPLRFGNSFSEDYEFDKVYLTEETVLLWSDLKFEETKETKEDIKEEKFFYNKPKTEEELFDILNVESNSTFNDVLTAYFNGEDYFTLVYLNKKNITSTSAELEWEFICPKKDELDEISISVGKRRKFSSKKLKDSLEIKDLNNISDYEIILLVTSKRGISNIFRTSITTLDDETNKAPLKENPITKAQGLVGISLRN